MIKENEKYSFNGKKYWDIYCSNCKRYLGGTWPGADHTYERAEICPYCNSSIHSTPPSRSGQPPEDSPSN
jgi:DNA-directed RNA polymerase subunit RPC12/RpoP